MLPCLTFILIGLSCGVNGGYLRRRDHHLDTLLPRSSGPLDENCGCDEDGNQRHQHRHLHEKLLSLNSSPKVLLPRSQSLNVKPNEPLNNGNFVFPLRPESVSLRESVLTTSEARPSREFNFPNVSPRQAKVNEYFYKSDPGHELMSPYTLKGKDGRLYSNYRPDSQVPDEHLPTAAAGVVPQYMPTPEANHQSPMNRRVARSLMPSEMFMGPPPPSNPQARPEMELPVKRNDASELMYPSDFGFASASFPRPNSPASGVPPPPMWNSFSQMSLPQWSSSNLSPVPVRLQGLSANGLSSNPLLSGASPVASPGSVSAQSNPNVSPNSGNSGVALPGQHPQMNMHNWYNFLNQPFYGPPMMNPFQTMGANPMDPSQPAGSPAKSTNGSSTEKEKNSTTEESSSSNDESAKPNNRRQRLLNQLNNLSRVPLENLRNFFQRVTSTTSTTESPKDNESKAKQIND
uniref:Uncharacterized protein n=1 Tax=Tetranychus urticae TaxID=32264 RepID=T1K5R0_TETUR